MKFFQLKKNFNLKNQYTKFDRINFTLGKATSKTQKIVENIFYTFENQNKKNGKK